jgi:nitroimidazol reductase NimA-like FMN-containing flavoprotein (pyridoxamine 5'-phosphate oxidase superfamily)
VRRLPQRAAYDRATVHAILDAGIVCHLGFVEDGRPVVIPTAYARVGDVVYVHGSSKSRTLCALADGVEVCLTVALIDGLVLARSAFHHSINYRSVMVFGRARALEDDEAKLAALEAFTERLHPGRWREVRPPSPPELKATKVLELPLEEAVAKSRSGGPLDDAEDYALPVWAGVLPLALVRGDPIPAPGLTARSD